MPWHCYRAWFFYGPIATLYRQAQGVTVFEITVIESISLALGILLEIPWGMIADKIGYRKTMIFCSSLAEETEAEPFCESFRQIFSNRTLLVFLVGVALLSEAHQTITVFLNQLQYERCGLSNSVIGLVYIVAILLGLLGAYSSAFTKRVGVRRSFALFCVLAAVSCLILGSTPFVLPSVISVLLLRLSNTQFLAPPGRSPKPADHKQKSSYCTQRLRYAGRWDCHWNQSGVWRPIRLESILCILLWQCDLHRWTASFLDMAEKGLWCVIA